jgi:hypothetical protein
MSYQQPRYINESQADLFQNMQNKIDNAVLTTKTTIAREKYRADVEMNQNIVEAGNASAALIKDINDQNYGDEFRTSKVDALFDNYETADGRTISWAERAKELTMEMRQNPKPENYGELKAELDFINGSPDLVKNSLENMVSQLDIKDREIDMTGNSDPILASYILGGKAGFAPGQGFDYKIRRGANNDIEYVFSGSATINGKEFKFSDGEYVLNSKTLQDYEDTNTDIIQGIPSETAQINSVIRDSNLFKNAEYDDDDVRTGGSFEDEIDLYRMEGDPVPGETTTVMKVKGSVLQRMGYSNVDPDKEYDFETWNIDATKVRDAMQQSINTNISGFIDPTSGDIDRARSYWNNRLAPSLGTEVMEINEIREAFGDFDEVASMSDEDVKSLWAEATGAWPSNLTELTPYQRAAFHKVYTDRAVNQVISEMNKDPFARRAGTFVDEEQEVKTAGKIVASNAANVQDVLEIKD